MSLVGTRPPTVDEWDKYELHHRARLATKPGLTGMWQVSGRSNITDLADFGILILIDSCCKLNEGTLSMCNDLADLGNNIVSVIALYTASIPVIYNSYDYNNNIENYDEYFRYKRKKYRTDATFSNINGFILEIGICILAFIVALKGYNFFQKYRRKRSALREFLNKDNMSHLQLSMQMTTMEKKHLLSFIIFL